MRAFIHISLIFLSISFYSFSFNNIPNSIETPLHKEIDSLLHQSEEYSYLDYEKSYGLAEQALSLSIKANYVIGEIQSNYVIGSILILQGKGDAAITYFENGLQKALKTENEILTAKGYSNISRYNLEMSDFSKAIENIELATKIYKNLKEEAEVSRCYSLLANIHKEMANYEKSLVYNFKSLKIKEALNDKNGIATVLSNIGNVYLLNNKYQEAYNYFQKSLKIDRENNNKEGIVYNLTRIGVAFQKMEQYDKALDYYKRALPMAQNSNFRINESVLLGNIGSTLRSQNHYDKSLKYLFAALKIKEELKQYGSAAHSCNDISETYLKIKDVKMAKIYAQKALEHSQNRNLNQQKYANYLLAKSEYLLGNYKSSYEFLTEFNVLKDSIFSINKASNINNLEIQYQTEKKEKEILELIQQKQTDLIKRNRYIIIGLLISAILLILFNWQRIKALKNRYLVEQARELDQFKSRFFTNVSHEFRAPLTLILGPIDELIENTHQTNDQKKLQIIRKNAERLLDQVNQLMELSKIESGHMLLKTSKSDIIKVIKGVSTSFHSLAVSKHIKLKLNVSPERLEINYDFKKFETIITNLLSNAFKFTPENGKISIKTKLIKQPYKKYFRKYLNIAVSDSGIGIPKEEINRIFDRFYQSKSAHFKQYKGTGIGLSYLKELVELHEGVIKVKSKIGRGTTITIQIPTDLPNSNFDNIGQHDIKNGNQALNRTVPIEFQNISKIDEEKPIILIIEDHEEIRLYIRDVLGSFFTIIEAVDGKEGIEKCFMDIPDLIISDVLMPKKNGYEVCETLKNDQRTSHIPIILLTGKSSSNDKIDGFTSKADDYITKPFNPQELRIRIQNLINSRKELKKKYRIEGVLEPKDVTVNSIGEIFLSKMIALIESNLANEKFNVDLLSTELGLSRSQLHRKLKALIDQAPNQFIRSYKLQRAYDLLNKGAATPSEVSFMVGFSSPSYFTKCFHEQFGATPSIIIRNKNI